MVSPHRLDETAPAQLRVACDQGEALCASGRGDDSVSAATARAQGCSRRAPSATGGIGDEEPDGAARRVVLEVVPGALESRRTLEEREHGGLVGGPLTVLRLVGAHRVPDRGEGGLVGQEPCVRDRTLRSEEHTSELQSLAYLVCRLLLEKK